MKDYRFWIAFLYFSDIWIDSEVVNSIFWTRYCSGYFAVLLLGVLLHCFSSFLDLSSLNSLPVTDGPDSCFPLSDLWEGSHCVHWWQFFENEYWWNKILSGDDMMYPCILTIQLLAPVVCFQSICFLDNGFPFTLRPELLLCCLQGNTSTDD